MWLIDEPPVLIPNARLPRLSVPEHPLSDLATRKVGHVFGTDSHARIVVTGRWLAPEDGVEDRVCIVSHLP